MSIFKDKVLLITGGTGSFGNAVLRRFLASDIKEIRILSRDEKKQDDMRHHLQAQYPEAATKVKFYIGNVREKASVDVAMRGVDYVFAAAALKQVPSCEFFPMEATMTNVIGTNNVLLSAIEHGVKNVVVLSTDKAAYPINAMGISKALMEKVAIAKGHKGSHEQDDNKDDDNPYGELSIYSKVFISLIICYFVISDESAMVITKYPCHGIMSILLCIITILVYEFSNSLITYAFVIIDYFFFNLVLSRIDIDAILESDHCNHS